MMDSKDRKVSLCTENVGEVSLCDIMSADILEHQ